jgi:hypothetical protein
VSEQGVNQQGGSAEGGADDVQLWEPQRLVRRVDPLEAALSRGFLRCHPEKWFPGFAGHWVTLTHALGCEAQIVEVKPCMGRPPLDEATFVGVVDGEPLLMVVEPESARVLCDELVPGAQGQAPQVVLEYVMRRLLASLALAWSGPESSQVSFKGRYSRGGYAAQGEASGANEIAVCASVKITFMVNTVPSTVWVALGRGLADRLDRLWRRQVHSSARPPSGDAKVRLEVAQLGVPPQMLSEYLSRGTVIDLEVKISDGLVVRYGTKPWMPGRMVSVDNFFGCEIVAGGLSTPSVAEGTTRLSVELGSLSLDATQLAELGQPGAILVTDIPLSERVDLVINSDRVGQARLCMYEGRFAIEVL